MLLTLWNVRTATAAQHCAEDAEDVADADRRAVQQRMDLSRLISGPLPRGLDGPDGEEPFQARDLIVSEYGVRAFGESLSPASQSGI